MKFTKTEIDLCKQIAERHRKELDVGDWFYVKMSDSDEPYIGCVTNTDKDRERPRLWDCYDASFEIAIVIPPWTISDCLEFLRERKRIDGEIRLAYIDHHDKYFAHIFEEDASAIRTKIILVESGKTPLEALLKAVLAVLEEKK